MNLKCVLAGLVFLSLSALPLRTAAEPSLTSAEANVAFAVSAICAPFVLDRIDPQELPIRQALVHPDGVDALGRPNPEAVRVGLAGFVHATFSAAGPAVRSCDVGAKDADPQALRNSVLHALASRPEHFVPMRSRYLPGRFDTEDMLCASPDSPRPGAFVLLSATRPEEQSRISILLTIADAKRMLSCDQPGVPMNYRTLAEPQ